MNRSTAYLKAVDELRGNGQQWQIFESTGHCVVRAGPGSGKTKTLTVKMMRMLQEDVRRPQGLACLTYSTECARELQRRLDRLGLVPHKNIFIGTVHGFCLSSILAPYSNLCDVDLPPDWGIATESQVAEYKRESLKIAFLDQKSPSESDLDCYRRTHLDRTSDAWRKTNAKLVRAVELYESKLHADGLIDFDDMVLVGLQLIQQHEWIRRILKARFPILVVDEYQDLGHPLHQLVESLCFNGGMRLLAVGDPDQSVYGFTGADPKLLNALAKREDIESVMLQTNYRCATEIVRASEKVLGKLPGEYNTPDTASVGKTPTIHHRPAGLSNQAEHICTVLIPSALEEIENLKLGNIAVLYLDKNDGDVIASAAEKANYSFIRVDKNAPYRRTPLTRWLENCAKWCTSGWQDGDPRFSTLIQQWLILTQYSSDKLLDPLDMKRRIVHFLWNHRNPDMLLYEWLQTFRQSCLDAVFYPNCRSRDEYAALVELTAQAAQRGKLAEYRVRTLAGQGGAEDHLNLITLYSAKGLEFDIVYLLGMEQGRIPWRNASSEKKAESRRLFFVGITRARHEVHILYSGWYENRFGRQLYGLTEFATSLRPTTDSFEDLI